MSRLEEAAKIDKEKDTLTFLYDPPHSIPHVSVTVWDKQQPMKREEVHAVRKDTELGGGNFQELYYKCTPLQTIPK